MSVRYLDLVDYAAIATEVTGLDADTLTKVADLGLADSALHAPMAEFGGTEFCDRLRRLERGPGSGVAS